MPERFERLYEAPKNQYYVGAPVIFEAGAITRDNAIEKLIIQLKIRNIEDKVIKGAKVTISLFDTIGESLNEELTYEYLDLNCECGDSFGSKTPIYLNGTSARGFKITHVVFMFSDNTKTETDIENIVSLTNSNKLYEMLGKEEQSEYVKRLSSKKNVLYNTYPEEKYDLWVCSCGAYNKANHEVCHNCKSSKEKVFDLDKTELKYRYAKNLMSQGEYNKASTWFLKINGYKDSDEQKNTCKQKILEIKAKEEAERLEAERKAEEQRIATKRMLKKVFAIGVPVVCVCIAFIFLIITVIIPKQKLNKAMDMIDSGDYDSAYALLKEIGNNEAIESSKYDRAMKLIDSEDFDSAYALLTEIGDMESIRSSKYDRAMKLIDSENFKSAYKLLAEIGERRTIKSSKYDRAIKLIESGDYEPAYMLLNGLEYKDSAKKLQGIKFKYQQIMLGKAKVGDIVNLGSYEQDNDTSNGKEDIEWLVLAKENGKALLISEYALDCQKYNSSNMDVTWETCSLRTWMNGKFLNNAFSADEQEIIATTNVSADKNPRFSTNPGNVTKDKVFLLSITEVEKYFTSAYERRCSITIYAKAQGPDTYARPWWLLRSPGNKQSYATSVYYDGSISTVGGVVNSNNHFVRPAMWVELKY